MKKQFALGLVLLIFVVRPLTSAFGQVPQLINYQGRLVDGTNLVNGDIGLSLRLFNLPSGGSSIYEDSNSVTVVDGLYSTFIGDNPTGSAMTTALTNEALWIEVAVNGIALSPREQIVSVGYSLSTRGLLVSTNNSFTHNPAENSVSPLTADSTIGGGKNVSIHDYADNSFIGGGRDNNIETDATFSVVGGGSNNRIDVNGSFSFLGGGSGNTIHDAVESAFLGGGSGNEIAAGAHASSLGGGSANSVTGPFGTVPGGAQNHAGTYSFAAGHRAYANQQGTFVWADSTEDDFIATGSNQFLIRASGGVGIGTNETAGAMLNVAGTVQATIFSGNGSGLTNLSGAAFAAGSISNSALAAGAVTASNIAPGSVGAMQLAKPYQSGSFTVPFFFAADAAVSVAFNPVFGATPIVTVALDASALDISTFGLSSLLVVQKAATGFTANVSMTNAFSFDSLFVANRASLALITNGPAVAYVNNSSQLFFRFVDGFPSVLAASQAGDPTLAEVNGKPAIAFDDLDSELSFVIATNASGSGFVAPLILDSPYNGPNSMCVVAGNPAICYGGAGELRYIRALDADGTAWGSPTNLGGFNVSGPSSMTIISGRPAIVCYDNNGLRYFYAADATGGAWNTSISVATNSGGFRASLCDVGGRPAIAFHDAQAELIPQYVRANDATGGTWGAAVSLGPVDASSDSPISLIVAGDKLAVSFASSSQSDARFVLSSDAAGTAWYPSVRVSSPSLPVSGDDMGTIVFAGGQVGMTFINGTQILRYLSASCVTSKVDWIAIQP